MLCAVHYLGIATVESASHGGSRLSDLVDHKDGGDTRIAPEGLYDAGVQLFSSPLVRSVNDHHNCKGRPSRGIEQN